MDDKFYYIYILAIKNHTTLYTGVKNNLLFRVMEHKENKGKSFSYRYNLHK